MKIETLFTDRKGGVSASPYDTLNLAYHTGDNPASVQENRKLLKSKMGVERVFYMEQVHGCEVAVVDTKSPDTLPSCDAVVTSASNIALAVMVADCIPILLSDSDRGVIAAVHAGRNGTFLNIAAKSIQKMAKEFGSDPEKIEAKLGPSIHGCCYEVSEELAQIARKNFTSKYVNGRYLDLQGINEKQLMEAGVKKSNIEISPICTCCDKNYFSYRREGVTGRFAGIIWMKGTLFKK